jgi:glycosyltransferase involved in cell wall biosynthesis
MVTHPIQYQAPLLRRIAQEADIALTAFFASDMSMGKYVDPGFSCAVSWDRELLDGYHYQFLPAIGPTDRASLLRPLNVGVGRRLAEGKFSALWVHGYMRPQHWFAAVVAKRLGMKVLVRDEATMIGRKRGQARIVLKRLFFAWLSRVADSFLAIGSLNRDYYLAQGIKTDRLFWTPYAVDNGFFQERSRVAALHREKLRGRLGLEPGRPVILFAGKLMGRKRPGDLLEAWARLATSPKQPPYLLYVGDGELRGELEARANELDNRSVRFLGFKNQSELPAYYDLCDVFVMPTMLEPWGLVVNEVMNAGKTVIVSDQVGCAPDLVRDGCNGLVYPAGDIDSLHGALVKLLTDANRRDHMGRKSLEIINRWSFEEDVIGLRAALDLG